MSAIIRTRNTDHLYLLTEELNERGYDRDVIPHQMDQSRVVVSSRESKKFRTVKSVEEVENDLKDLLYGFVEVAFTNPEKASYRL